MRALARIAAIAAGAAALSLQTLRAQTYGPSEQVLTIGAVEFTGALTASPGLLDGATGYQFAVGPLEFGRPEFVDYRAPLALPEGARITRLCMWVFDGVDDKNITASLEVAKLATVGETPAQLELSPVESRLAPGYHSYCGDLDQRVTRSYDVDGDSVPDPVAWYLKVVYSSVRGLGFGAVQVTWRRDVRDAPATPSFSDVSGDHAFYRFIEALAASGITGGCGAGTFCPDAPLKRGQMAVFLAKALGLHWPN